MRELSLHILDLIENSVRAGVSIIWIAIEEDREADTLTIRVEDNGSGLKVTPREAQSPFYTTKQGKRTGMGLSLIEAAARQAGGGLEIGRSELGGLQVTVKMGLGHIDRMPLGDLAATVSSVVCTNPQVEIVCRLKSGDREMTVRVSDYSESLGPGELGGLELARRVSESIKTAMATVELSA